MNGSEFGTVLDGEKGEENVGWMIELGGKGLIQ